MASRIHIIAIGLPALLVNAALAQQSEPRPVDESAPVVPATDAADASAQDPISAPPRLPTIWNDAPSDPAIPVFDAVVVQQHGMIAVLGGMDGSMRARKIIQVHHPERGWLPIGSQMLEARMGHTLTPLGDGRVLIAGGFSGKMGADIAPLKSAEVLDPFGAVSHPIEPLEQSLWGHTAHALPRGRAVVVGGNYAHVFAGESMSWTHHILLRGTRHDHASVLLDDHLLVLIGSDHRGSIESIDFKADDPVAERWTTRFPFALSRCSAVRLPDGRIFVAGGIDESNSHSVSSTWFIDAAARTIEPGPDLAVAGGAATLALMLDDGRVAILGGERRTDIERHPANVARLYDPGQDRLWSLPSPPDNTLRRNWYRDAEGRIAFIAGYRFIYEEETTDREYLPMGPLVTGAGHSIRIGGFTPMTD